MKFSIYFILFTLVGSILFSDIFSSIAFALTAALILHIILESNETFVFREWALLLYAVNYLLSPAITYQLNKDQIVYAMKIDSNTYFSIAIPGFLLFAVGMFVFRTTIFKPDFFEIRRATLINERFIVQMTIVGVICRLTSDLFSTDLSFLFYLISMIRFVGVFALFALNPSKYGYIVLLILGFELYNGFKNAMFHDAIMWIIFFGFFYMYIKKPSMIVKVTSSVLFILFVLLVQSFKGDYRERVWRGGEESNFETIRDVGLNKAKTEVLTGEDNLLGTLNRGNQAWIFASTIDNMDRIKNFQGMNNVNLYLESALLPRFIAPNKLISGDKLIFNQFSGHEIGSGTSMGLGIFADGYISYGVWGVYVFTFVFGLLFSLTFKLVQSWSKLSHFYVLLILPMLNYAVRPDCETQTIINHLSKSIIVFGSLVYLTKYRFTFSSTTIFKK